VLPRSVVEARGRLLDRDPSSAVVLGSLVENLCSGSEEEAETETGKAGEEEPLKEEAAAATAAEAET